MEEKEEGDVWERGTKRRKKRGRRTICIIVCGNTIRKATRRISNKKTLLEAEGPSRARAPARQGTRQAIFPIVSSLFEGNSSRALGEVLVPPMEHTKRSGSRSRAHRLVHRRGKTWSIGTFYTLVSHSSLCNSPFSQGSRPTKAYHCKI